MALNNEDLLEDFDLKKFEWGKNLYIEASAGTGKTYTIQLIVAKLIASGVPLSKILLVTYTEKAVGELKDRIRKKIMEVLNNKKIDRDFPDLTVEEIKRFEAAYQESDRAPIFTIHSFCQKTIREFAYEAGLPFDLEMENDENVKGLVGKYIRDKWANESDFQVLFKTSDNFKTAIENFSEKLTKAVQLYQGENKNGENVLLENSSGEVLDAETWEKFENHWAKGEYFQALLLFPSYKKHWEVLENHKEENFSYLKQKTSKSQYSSKVTDFMNKCKSWDGENNLFDKTAGVKFVEDSVESQELSDALSFFYDQKDKAKNKREELLEDQINHFIVQQVPPIYAEWKREKIKWRKQSFDDMILAVHEKIMNENSDEEADSTSGASIKKCLREKFQCAIIDEFQDTNQLQWDIFREIFLKSPSGNFVIVVGDPKQSIYSFRGADVNVYLKATKEIGKGNRLSHNYRSSSEMISACNLLSQKIFEEGDISFEDSNSPGINESSPTFDGEKIPPVWLCGSPSENLDDRSFARAIANQIVEFCSKDENQKTRLQIPDGEGFRNVRLRDFAVLARKRIEMIPFKNAFRQIGLPYAHYKENGLFGGRECAEWIALLRALDIDDFNGKNRLILNEVLLSDFFKAARKKRFQLQNQKLEDLKTDSASTDSIPDEDSPTEENNFIEWTIREQEWLLISNPIFDDPNIEERKTINAWRALAQNKRYAELLESIYSLSEIERELSDFKNLSTLAKFRQIGNYIVDYLYSGNGSLNDLAGHLERLSQNEIQAEENGQLVENSPDFDAVQVMTIHAAKGLEFPIVISAADFSPPELKKMRAFLFHQENKLYIGFSKNAKEIKKKEEIEEQKRLCYVDFTRAKSLLFIPYHKENKPGLLETILENFDTEKTYHRDFSPLALNDFKVEELSEKVKSILSVSIDENTSEEEKSKRYENQLNAIEKLQRKIPSLGLSKYSYSSLTGRADNLTSNIEEKNFDPDDSESAHFLDKKFIKTIDPEGLPLFPLKETSSTETSSASTKALSSSTEISSTEASATEIPPDYPRGNKVGNALHRIFEKIPFDEFGEKFQTLEEALELKGMEWVEALIVNEFRAEYLPIENSQRKKSWVEVTKRFIWNTLHAKLPACENTVKNAGEKEFQLIEISKDARRAEVPFAMNVQSLSEEKMKGICNGFIDLIFCRTDSSGNARYSILDWKSDRIENGDYSPRALKEKVDEEYSIQRVLYSYCLILWLRQFFGEGTPENLSDEEIFEKHFGGIYYVFLRGTDGKSDRGIYAQTWKNFSLLKKAYEKVKTLMGNRFKNDKQ